MKSKKTLKSLIVISVVAVLFSIAWVKHGDSCATKGYGGWGRGDCGKGGYGWKHGGGGDSLGGICDNLPTPCGLLCQKDELGLTDEQESELKKLKSSSQKAKVKRHADIQILKIEIQELLDEKTVDKDAVYAKLEEIGKLRTTKAKNCIDTKLTARKLLTAEQLKKWEAVKKSCQFGDPKYDGKQGKKKAAGSQAKKDCGSKNWADANAQL